MPRRYRLNQCLARHFAASAAMQSSTSNSVNVHFVSAHHTRDGALQFGYLRPGLLHFVEDRRSATPGAKRRQKSAEVNSHGLLAKSASAGDSVNLLDSASSYS
jgi:hypothetical protein